MIFTIFQKFGHQAGLSNRPHNGCELPGGAGFTISVKTIDVQCFGLGAFLPIGAIWSPGYCVSCPNLF
jgi:hypothetical protein